MSVAPKPVVSAQTVTTKKAGVTSIQSRKRLDRSSPIEFTHPSEPGSLRFQPKRRLDAVSTEIGLSPHHTVVASRETLRQTAKIVPPSRSLPIWLRWLMAWQRRSSLVTFCLAAITLAVYGGTVYTQQLWSGEYRKLETLERQARELTATREVLKNQLAEQAQEPNAGLVPTTPGHTVFLESEPLQERTTPLEATPTPTPAPHPELTPKSLGY